MGKKIVVLAPLFKRKKKKCGDRAASFIFVLHNGSKRLVDAFDGLSHRGLYLKKQAKDVRGSWHPNTTSSHSLDGRKVAASFRQSQYQG